MATGTRSMQHSVPFSHRNGKIPPLENGDRLDQKTFHARYEAMPGDVRAELIGGTVYMSSPLKPRHGRMQAKLMGWLAYYEEETPGVELYDNTTVILGEESEPQPDAYLVVSPEKGGQTHYNDDEYLKGPPELIGEVASSSEAIDLYGKKLDYERAGVKEYLVAALRQDRVFWFISRRGKFKDLAPGPDGIVRSVIFPGLWLDPEALLRLDSKRLRAVLCEGLASDEHKMFVKKLAGK